MPATDAAPGPSSASPATGQALLPVKDEPAIAVETPGEEPATTGGRLAGLTKQLGPWAFSAVVLALTAGGGWYAGAHSAAVSGAQRAAIDSLLADDLRSHSASLAELEARLKAMEDANPKIAIDILAKRIDEIARTQTAALNHTASRFERTDKEIGVRLDRMSERLGERMDRIEKQVSSAAPVGSVEKTAASGPTTTTVNRSGPESAPKPQGAAVPLINEYVLRDFFGGGAIVEGNAGLMEVSPAAVLPGAGRVRGVERRDGRWVLVTSRGVIDSRR